MMISYEPCCRAPRFVLRIAWEKVNFRAEHHS